MTPSDSAHGGLVFAGRQSQTLHRFCRAAAATFTDYGHPVDRLSVREDGTALVLTSRYRLRLTLNEPGASLPERCLRIDRAAGLNCGRRAPFPEQAQHRLALALTPVSPGSEDRDLTEMILVIMLFRMIDLCSVSEVEWLSPETILSKERFLSAFRSVTPRRVSLSEALDQKGPRKSTRPPMRRIELDEGLPTLPESLAAVTPRHPVVKPTHPAPVPAAAMPPRPIQLTGPGGLDLAARVDRPATAPDSAPQIATAIAQGDIRRLATWGMTGVLATLSLPAALPMAALNLARGEDFRLNTQVLSLAGLLVILQNSGALAQIVSHLPG